MTNFCCKNLSLWVMPAVKRPQDTLFERLFRPHTIFSKWCGAFGCSHAHNIYFERGDCYMRATRFLLYLIALALVLALSACSLSPTSGPDTLQQSSPPSTSTPAVVTPTIVPTSTAKPKPIPVRLLIPHIGINASV